MGDIINALLSMADLLIAGGVSTAIIQEAESALQLKFSEDYKQYLEQFGLVAYDGHELTGICKASHLDIVGTTRNEKRKNSHIPDDFYVIEVANIDGIVIWQKSSGEIFQTIFDSAPVQICSSLTEYVNL